MSGAALETALAAISATGLVPRGALAVEEKERRGELADVRTIVLAGMAGRDGWSAFAASPEAADGADDPLDRWSRRVIEALARDLGAQALFPFGGPPFWPFQQWARRAEPVHPSPIGLLIHPVYGLWHSYRGALAFREALDVARTRGGAKSLRLLPRPLGASAPVPSARFRPAATTSPPAPAIWRTRPARTAWRLGAGRVGPARSGLSTPMAQTRRVSPCARFLRAQAAAR